MASRVEKIKGEIAQRYDNIVNLYVAYMNSGKYPDMFGREFFHAVGDILQGTPVKQLVLFHLEANEVEQIVNHTMSKGGIPGSNKKRKPERDNRRKAKVSKKVKVSVKKRRRGAR